MQAAKPSLPELTDMRAAAAQARERSVPILIMFSATYCGYCKRLAQDYLIPMLKSGDYDNKVIMYQVTTDSYTSLVDLSGRQVAASRFAFGFRAYLTPTLVFLDHRGSQVAAPIVGYTTPQLFGGYLDTAIDTALARCRGGSPLPTHRPQPPTTRGSPP